MAQWERRAPARRSGGRSFFVLAQSCVESIKHWPPGVHTCLRYAQRLHPSVGPSPGAGGPFGSLWVLVAESPSVPTPGGLQRPYLHVALHFGLKPGQHGCWEFSLWLAKEVSSELAPGRAWECEDGDQGCASAAPRSAAWERLRDGPGPGTCVSHMVGT